MAVSVRASFRVRRDGCESPRRSIGDGTARRAPPPRRIRMTRTRLAGLAGMAALMAALTAAAANAQEVTGSISGSVEDQQGQAIPGATVTAVNQRTASARVDHSDGKGNFLFTAMPPGTYAIRAEMPN